MPLLLLLGAVAALAYGFSKGSGATPSSHVIPGPAGADVLHLPAGSIVLLKSFGEALTILSQGPKGYFGRSVISGTGVTFTPDEITTVQFVAPSVPGLALPAPLATTPTVSAGRWY